MKTDKKLKRGLADLSKLFLQGQELPPQEQAKATLAIEPPTDASLDSRLPRLSCTAFLPSGDVFQVMDLIHLLDVFKTVFQEIYLLSVGPAHSGYEVLCDPRSSPWLANGKDRSVIPLRSGGEGIAFGYISSDQFQDILHPKITSSSVPDFATEKKALVIFDSIFPSDPADGLLSSAGGVFELLDHGVFVIPADLDQIMRAYELIRFCLARNQSLRCSILLVGRGAETSWEFVYEHFNTIVSQFLGCDLGFLGWTENGHMRLNSELFLEEGGNMIQLSSKARLAQVLYAGRNGLQKEISNGVCRPLLSG